MRLKRPRINGYRGLIQLEFAILYMLVGYFYFQPPDTERLQSLTWITAILPIQSLGWVWLTAAGCALVGAFCSRPRDKFSFQALAFAPLVLASMNFVGWILGDNPDGWVRGIMYALIAVVAMTQSGVQGDTDRDKRRVIQ